jgi:arylsulfatase A-like enzyme
MECRPNVLWVVTTQWRAQSCGLAGEPQVRTPHLDAVGRAGVHFTQAVTPHPFGPFARAALLTGVPSPANGVADYFDPLPLGARTIAHELRELGYTTAFFGKWHLAPRDPSAPLVGDAHARTVVPPERRGGFQFWEGFESGFVLNDPWLHGTRVPEPTRFAGYQADVLCDRAAGWMAAAPGAPWFTVVSMEPPHPPYTAPAGGFVPREPGNVVVPPNVPAAAAGQARQELAGYYAHIEATDAAIGRLLRAVDRRRTVVVITSVHGDMHGAQGLFRKGWPHEESIRVPLVVSLPATLAAPGWTGASEAEVTLLDVPGWTRDWAQGRSATVGGGPQRISMPSIVRLPHQCDRVWRGVRTSRRKFVAARSPDGRWVPWLLHDLEHDRFERTNLVPVARPGEIAAFIREIEEFDRAPARRAAP